MTEMQIRLGMGDSCSSWCLPLASIVTATKLSVLTAPPRLNLTESGQSSVLSGLLQLRLNSGQPRPCARLVKSALLVQDRAQSEAAPAAPGAMMKMRGKWMGLEHGHSHPHSRAHGHDHHHGLRLSHITIEIEYPGDCSMTETRIEEMPATP